MNINNIPNNLQIEDGKVTMLDGSDPTKYLAKWMRDNKISNGAVVNVTLRIDLCQISNQLWEQRYLTQAA